MIRVPSGQGTAQPGAPWAAQGAMRDGGRQAGAAEGPQKAQKAQKVLTTEDTEGADRNGRKEAQKAQKKRATEGAQKGREK